MILFKSKFFLNLLFAALATTAGNPSMSPTLEMTMEISVEEYSHLHSTICDLDNRLNIIQDQTENIKAHKKVSRPEILEYMKKRLICPEANYALAVHESGNFDSPFYDRSNNMFCMGLNNRKLYDFKVWNGGDKDYKCGFNDWRTSIDDMAAWQARHIKSGKLYASSNLTYIRTLKKTGYAVDQEHGRKVEQHFIDIFTSS